jgi:uncharacterized protein YqjF (DUF2071 family)
MRAAPSKVFLTAEWRNLVLLNYEIEPGVLQPFVPAGTELDFWHDRAYVSMVGFQFLRTSVWGVPIPFHRNFEEVNLRFYVRRQTADGWRRGVVFIKEIVPRLAIAFVARRFYHEPYIALPMSHQIEVAQGTVKSARYSWQWGGAVQELNLITRGRAQTLVAGSEAEFITEHYWGYNTQRDGTTLEYQVEHPRWRVYPAAEAWLDGDVGKLYGSQFAGFVRRNPFSAFLAEGSPVTVYQGNMVAA